jgi:hypothetical protein
MDETGEKNLFWEDIKDKLEVKSIPKNMLK